MQHFYTANSILSESVNQLSKRNVTIKVGQSIILKVIGTKKKVNGPVVNLLWQRSQKGKVTSKKAGSVKITTKVI